MNKEQLINEIQDNVASPPEYEGEHPKMVWHDREMRKAIVLAYNKGIEDATDTVRCYEESCRRGLDEAEKLKIE